MCETEEATSDTKQERDLEISKWLSNMQKCNSQDIKKWINSNNFQNRNWLAAYLAAFASAVLHINHYKPVFFCVSIRKFSACSPSSVNLFCSLSTLLSSATHLWLHLYIFSVSNVVIRFQLQNIFSHSI